MQQVNFSLKKMFLIFVLLFGLGYYPLFTLISFFLPDPIGDFIVNELWFYFSFLVALLWSGGKSGIANVIRKKQDIPFQLVLMSLLSLMIFSYSAAVSFGYILYLLDPEILVTWFGEGVSVLSPDSNWPVVYTVLSVITFDLIAPVTEELLFRFALFEAFRKKFDWKVAMFSSAAIFAILHVDMFGGFAFALLMSLLYIRTGSLFYPIVIHIANNFIVSLMQISSSEAVEAISIVDEVAAVGPYGAIGLAISLPVIIWLSKKFWSSYKFNSEK